MILKHIYPVMVLIAIIIIALSTAGCSSGNSPRDNAASDFEHKLGIVAEQQQAIISSVNATAHTTLDAPTLRSTLVAERAMDFELINRTDAALSSGEAYLKYLQPSTDEYERVTKEMAQMIAFVDSAKYHYNSGADLYNKYWGSANDTMPLF
jgi:uncharacterized membrane protein YcgQ (UPF0703/DUF1980 family)